MNKKLNRRDFLKTAAFAGTALAFNPQFAFSRNIATPTRKERLSIGVIGVGMRGRHLMNLASREENVVITAICDVSQSAIDLAQGILEKGGHKKAVAYTGSDYAYRDLLNRKDIDGVIIAANWDWHVPMTIDAMRAKKYVGLEVPAAMTMEDCWKLVEVYEETHTNVMFLENCCYDRECMAILQMLRDGMFGIPMHATCGYRHSAWGSEKWLKPVNTTTKIEHFVKYSALRNADQYPTHGIGPVANWFNINRGNRFLYLTSTATKPQAINEFARQHNNPNANYKFKQGDVVTTVIKTIKDETIVVNYDNYLPRPYSRDYSLQGTNGIWSGLYLGRGIYFEGKSPKDKWEKEKEYDAYMEKYDHPLWKDFYAKAQNAGHGGIDYFTIKEYIRSVRESAYPPIDIYDAVTWSSIIPLSEASLAKGSTPEFFPDFTKERWKTRKPMFGL
ncbi:MULTISPECIES: Gfo/Idh/MocA family oxidoreductase [unclassified Prevotella]|jgi:hypothetical protein|uniref:Gfo/Idh/MocA family oxidoreductase n=1 Tax=unclassified Prevotella TaxID=2638335 RepID=UPI0008C34CC3|nr:MULTISPECIES: Gfo/Idh/MocA family oxidoreductase [unclassified Prevotella]MCI1648649.1 Gfo/Idh/MocA family oxidoreductase [Bacteroides sp.]SES68039.1 Tat (twin-arginine translocation) pathway signal sequence [Prevotella sp. kh1p2]SFF81614.1 Tat (twin-arginine translocation) pathway signal sequence [Prevotella sp. KH2C16]SNU10253.1 Tat (twin-arginine translocation) pathway signal sequence [Prevotellaceae bacterium KH2P17]